MEVTSGVFMLRASPQSHVYLIRGDINILVDTGVPGAGRRILGELASMDVQTDSVGAILLTHHDVDHIGNLKRLAEATGARIFAPGEDIPYITGEAARPGIKRAIALFIRPAVPEGISPFGREEIKEVRVIPAPGHTKGHVILLYKNVLFAGDLLRAVKGEPAPMADFMNWDSKLAAGSIGLLKSLDFDWICPAHGAPMPREALQDFLKDY